MSKLAVPNMLSSLVGTPPEPTPDATLVIALAGAIRSGKSTFAQSLAASVGGIVISFADPLRESAARACWDATRKHDPEQRTFIQQHSQQEKDRYGEDVYAQATCLRMLSLVNRHRVIIIDDLRHYVEIGSLLKMEQAECGTVTMLPVHFHNPLAETRWLQAAMAPRTEATAWAHHRSELEWRSYRHNFIQYNNEQLLVPSQDEAADLREAQRSFKNWMLRNSNVFYDIELKSRQQRSI